MEEFGLRYVTGEAEAGELRQETEQKWRGLQEQFNQGICMPSMELLHVAGRWGRRLVSGVDDKIKKIVHGYETGVDLAFNIFGISMDNSIDRNPLVSPLSKGRRRIPSPASSTSGSIGFRGNTQQQYRHSPIPISPCGMNMDEWQQEEGYKEIQRIQAARRVPITPTVQPPESIRSDISSETNR